MLNYTTMNYLCNAKHSEYHINIAKTEKPGKEHTYIRSGRYEVRLWP